MDQKTNEPFTDWKATASAGIVGMVEWSFALWLGLALTGAFATTSLEEGVLYMAAFGMGTLPLMSFISFGSQFLTSKGRWWVKKLTPMILLLMGAYFLYRGMRIELPNAYRLGTGINENIEMCH